MHDRNYANRFYLSTIFIHKMLLRFHDGSIGEMSAAVKENRAVPCISLPGEFCSPRPFHSSIANARIGDASALIFKGTAKNVTLSFLIRVRLQRYSICKMPFAKCII